MPGPSDRNLNDLVAFTRVVEAGSFTAAARSMDLPKSTVSRRVSRLEADLGVRLLQRTTRRLSLTAAGQLYYDTGRQALAQLDEAEARLSEAKSTPTGRIRIAAPPEHAVTSELVSQFMTRYPDVVVELELASRQVNVIEEGFDVAICAGPVEQLSVVAHKLIDSPFRLVASPAYLDTHGRPRRISDLSRHAAVFFGPAGCAPVWTLPSAKGPQRVELRARASANHLGAVRAATLAGHGIALMPTLLCGRDVEAGLLEIVLRSVRPPPVPIWLLWPSSRYLPRATRVFIDYVKAHFATLAGPLNP